jgi:hypothetical protein
MKGERTGGSAVIRSRGTTSVAREGERTRLGEKAAERRESFFRADGTAEAVTYKATAEAKNAVDVFSCGR